MGEEPRRLRAVFDCMVFLQGAARETSPAGICLHLADSGLIDLFVSDDIMAEIGDVLRRPLLQRKFSVLTDEFVDQFVAALLLRALPISDMPRVFEYPRDPKDERYINLALAAQADYLVSRDTDILDLGSTERPEGRRFREQYPHLKIVDPVTFLRAVQKSSEVWRNWQDWQERRSHCTSITRGRKKILTGFSNFDAEQNRPGPPLSHAQFGAIPPVNSLLEPARTHSHSLTNFL